MVINRFEVYLVNLDPTVGKEIKKMLVLDVLQELFAP
jgi:mRNA-degrading endonuclease toxin of MazEF toxin-antitoxin module